MPNKSTSYTPNLPPWYDVHTVEALDTSLTTRSGGITYTQVEGVDMTDAAHSPTRVKIAPLPDHTIIEPGDIITFYVYSHVERPSFGDTCYTALSINRGLPIPTQPVGGDASVFGPWPDCPAEVMKAFSLLYVEVLPFTTMRHDPVTHPRWPELPTWMAATPSWEMATDDPTDEEVRANLQHYLNTPAGREHMANIIGGMVAELNRQDIAPRTTEQPGSPQEDE